MRLLSRRKSFNSTLVQLKVWNIRYCIMVKSGFNSTLVQLKAIAFPCISVVSTGFNSTLVQLKVAGECAKTYCRDVSILP